MSAMDKVKCQSCGAEILWVTTHKRVKQSLDPKPEQRVVMRGGMAFSMPTYMPHHATCPQAEKWRKNQ